MSNYYSISKLYGRLWLHINPQRKIQLFGLLALMVLASFSEVISIGSALPFLATLTKPDLIFNHHLAQPLIHFLGINSPNELILPVAIIFGAAVIFAAGLRLLLLWASTHIAFAAGGDLSYDMYRHTLYQPYSIHLSRNSSEVISGISTKSNSIIYGMMLPGLTLLSSGVILIFILITLVYVDPIIATISLFGFGLIYVTIIKATRKRLKVNSEKIAQSSVSVIKALQEGLGGIRDILLDRNQETYCKIYQKSDKLLRLAQGYNFFIGQSPRYGTEAIGMLLIITLAYFLSQGPNGISSTITLLGIFALGAQRILPVLQQGYNSWTAIQGGVASFHDALELLDQSMPSDDDLSNNSIIAFKNSVLLKNISFQYEVDSPWVLKNLNLIINKGDRIGFIGKTGCGKSTLLDIVMALLNPTAGVLMVDGQVISSSNSRNWQAHISHVPQAIFLADCTVAENIAFGNPSHKIDYQLVKKAAYRAQISEEIESWPSGYATLVGERGVRLSGGQRQRIGIARALYKQSSLIIFDEATSALDGKTEDEVIKSIYGLDDTITVLIIAHRLTTLKNCTKIIELDGVGVNYIGSYKELCAKVRL
jgi:ABC-type multidrug transport system fused ATPase/permease subunit